MTVDVDELVRAVDRLIDEARRPVREGVGSACDLAAVTRDRVRFWAVLAEEQGRAFTTDIVDGPCEVAATSGDLEAALDALLGNVLAHTPEGTDFRVSARSSARAAGAPERLRRAWLLVLDDDGPGFPAEGVIERGSSGAGSTGLGLDIVRRTAEHTGGSMRLRASRRRRRPHRGHLRRHRRLTPDRPTGDPAAGPTPRAYPRAPTGRVGWTRWARRPAGEVRAGRAPGPRPRRSGGGEQTLQERRCRHARLVVVPGVVTRRSAW